MLNKSIIATGVGALVLLGGGGAALAATTGTGSSQAVAPTTTSTSTAKVHHHKGKDKAFRGEYAQWTSYDAKTKTTVVHDGVRGVVSAVSPTAISIKTADGTVKAYTVTATTKVHVKGSTASTTTTINGVKVGDRAEVTGTGSATLTATHVQDHGTPKAK